MKRLALLLLFASCKDFSSGDSIAVKGYADQEVMIHVKPKVYAPYEKILVVHVPTPFGYPALAEKDIK